MDYAISVQQSLWWPGVKLTLKIVSFQSEFKVNSLLELMAVILNLKSADFYEFGVQTLDEIF